MANIQESILQAVDTLVQNRINGIEADKTVIATIVACSNAFTREYKVSYNGGTMPAYAQEGATYSNNASVYVLVPQGDFTQKKTIIGKTQSISDDQNISFVSSALSDYNMIGANCIKDKKKVTPGGLNSYYKADYKLLYKYKDDEHSSQYLDIDFEELENNLREAEAVMLEASFRTELPKQHRYSSTGRYGLQFVLAFKDKSQDPVSILDIDDLQNAVTSEQNLNRVSAVETVVNKLTSLWLHDGFVQKTKTECLATLNECLDTLNIYNESPTEQDKPSNQTHTQESLTEQDKDSNQMRIQKAVDHLKNLVKELTQIINAANSVNAVGYDCADLVLKYIYLPKEKEYTEEERKFNTVVKKKFDSYTIDSNQMVGSPLNFNMAAEQYSIFPIDKDNFLYIDSILFYSQDFVKKDDAIQADMYGNDIFVQDIEFYGLRKISAKNGEYALSLSMPQGNTFKSIREDDTLKIIGKVTQNININLSETTTFYWLKQDSRIDSSQAFAYAGKGWRLLEDKGHGYACYLDAKNNLAFENKYLCIAIYHDKLILKEEFVLYNNAVKRNLTINSSLGTKFSFDRGVPTLTCLVDNKIENFEADKPNGHPDNYFNFVWSKVAADGTVTIFNESKETLEKRYNETIKSGEFNYSELSSLKNQILQLDGVSWDKNVLNYPVKQIDTQETFKCDVYLRDNEPTGQQTIRDIEYSIGAPEITLLNEGVATAKDYYIEITNGDQTFQYSESGVSPDNKRNENPQKILPLQCVFYDPNGYVVSSSAYEVKWKFPLQNTMIIAPTLNVHTNPTNNKPEWCMSQIYPVTIASNFNYNCMNNQIQCIVNYQGQTYTQYTNMLFTKIGENGTNGTDIVARIDIEKKNLHDDEMPALMFNQEQIDGKNVWVPQWNTGIAVDGKTPVFKFKLYHRDELLDAKTVYWSMAGGRAKWFKPDYGTLQGNQVQDATLNYNGENISGMFRTQVVKATTTWENTQYVAFCPFVTIYQNNLKYRLEVSEANTLKYIMYNANGYNPLYNKNQGANVRVMDGQVNLNDFYYEWTAQGGSKQETNPDFLLLEKQNDKQGQQIIYGQNIQQVYILPNDFYSGEYVNNRIRCRVYTTQRDYELGGTPSFEVYIPIFMSLNKNELQSLNDWDGTHLEINQDENYILAPQIGAGKKEEDNTFTGLVMGEATYYDIKNNFGQLESSKTVGLLGYSHGQQSVFIDAETGKAVFGLPENKSQQPDDFSAKEGRIELVPGGISTIGNWRIGANSLYNVTQHDIYHSDIGDKYSDLSDKYKVSIPSDAEGILLSSQPAYISIKSRPLEDGDADYTAANTIVQQYDSFELQLDPNDRSVFTVYRHTAAPENKLFVIWEDRIWLATDLIPNEDGNGGYTIVKGKEDAYLADASKYIQKINGIKRYVGWDTHAKCGTVYIIARPTKDINSQIADDTYYFCSVASEGKYLLPEYITDADDQKNANKQIFDNLVWHREAKVGINTQGRFYTNALKDSTTALNIGPLGAFGQSALANGFVGATFEVGTEDRSNSLIKFFTDSADINKKTGTLYISGATDTNSEYQRPIKVYGNTIGLYSNPTGKFVSKDSNIKIELNNDGVQMGYIPSDGKKPYYFKIPFNTKQFQDADGATVENHAELMLSNSFFISTPTDKEFVVETGDASITLGDPWRENGHGNFILDVFNGNFTIRNKAMAVIKNRFSIDSQYFMIEDTNDKQIQVVSKTKILKDDGTETNNPYFKLCLNGAPNGNPTKLETQGAVEIKTNVGGFNVTTNGAAEGIKLSAIPVDAKLENGVSFSMVPLTDGRSQFFLRSPLGNIESKENIATYKDNNDYDKGVNGIIIDPCFVTNYGFFNTWIPGTDDSIQAVWDITSTRGNIKATKGNIKAISGNIEAPEGQFYGAGVTINEGGCLNWVYTDDGKKKISDWSLENMRSMWKCHTNGWSAHTYANIDQRITNAQTDATDAWNYANDVNTALKDKAGNDVWDYAKAVKTSVSAIQSYLLAASTAATLGGVQTQLGNAAAVPLP